MPRFEETQKYNINKTPKYSRTCKKYILLQKTHLKYQRKEKKDTELDLKN